MAKHNEIGKLGEELAKEHLIQHGYTILRTNYRYLKAEIDIIAQKDDILAIDLMLKGGEGFGWTHVQSLTTQPAYDPAADTALYDDPAPGSILTVPEGFFVLVWPWDAHRPTMATGPDRTPRVKGVVKILC